MKKYNCRPVSGRSSVSTPRCRDGTGPCTMSSTEPSTGMCSRSRWRGWCTHATLVSSYFDLRSIYLKMNATHTDVNLIIYHESWRHSRVFSIMALTSCLAVRTNISIFLISRHRRSDQRTALPQTAPAPVQSLLFRLPLPHDPGRAHLPAH